ncbi:MAG: pyridoxal 5'-phosphate synthase glutaminase subunit PdxT [Betaproteobacteria bacterium]|nr:pyridoxal 5'-phosphate synthase glutaminase subunit PdxT [Betaproteobacteria bacterium]
MKIGLLALQGAFREHREMVGALGASTVDVRRPEDLADCDGLIIPGGESTAIAKLMALYGLYDAIRAHHAQGMALFGTCAGAILLASKIEGALPDQVPLGLMDVTIKRNAYGRQIASFETLLPFEGADGGEVRAVFIRAPRFAEWGANVKVLSTHNGEPVALREGRLLAVAFHPELTSDTRVHKYFLENVVGTQVI